MTNAKLQMLAAAGAVAAACFGARPSTAHAAEVAFDRFESSLGLNSYSQTPPQATVVSTWSAGDWFGVGTIGAWPQQPAGMPFALADDSAVSVSVPGGSPFAGDTEGVIRSTFGNTNAFLAMVDTENPQNTNGPVGPGNTGIEVVATWQFTVPAGTTNLALNIDAAGNSDYEDGVTDSGASFEDRFSFSYSSNGGPEVLAIDSSVNTAGSYSFTMENGTVVNRDDPISAVPVGGTTVQLDNIFRTVTAPIVATPGTLTVTFRGLMDTEAVAFDNLVITGDVIPEPTSLALLAAGGSILLLRRRRAV